jgi:hypothetical protein
MSKRSAIVKPAPETAPANDLEAFVADWLKTTEPAPTSIVLAHIVEGAGAVVLDTIELGAEKPDRAAICRRLERQARSHCDAMGSSERYSVAVMQSRLVLGQHQARLEPAGGIAPTMRATPEYLLNAGLRHIERQQELAQKGTQAVIMNLARTNDRLAQENEALRVDAARLRADQIKASELVQDLLDRRAERQMALEAEQLQQKRYDKALEIGSDLAKIVAGHISGAGPLETLIAKLPASSVDMLAELLDEEGRAALRDAMAHVQMSQGARERLLTLVKPGARPEPSKDASHA